MSTTVNLLGGPNRVFNNTTPAAPAAATNVAWQADGVNVSANIPVGNLTETVSSVLAITGGTGAVVGSGVSIQVEQASASQSGYLSSTDWSTFASKQAALSVANDTNVTGSVSGGTLTLGWTGTLAASRLNSNVVQSVTNDTNITGSIASQTLTLGFTGTLAAARLNSNVVQAITNDTNVTGSISSQTLTLGWTGTLAIARGGTGASTAATALSNLGGASLTANNTFSGTQTFNGAATFNSTTTVNSGGYLAQFNTTTIDLNLNVSGSGGWARAYRLTNGAVSGQQSAVFGALGNTGSSTLSYVYFGVADSTNDSTGYDSTKVIQIDTNGNLTAPQNATVSGNLTVSGSVNTKVRQATANDTSTTADCTLILNGTSITETLPASPGSGQELYLVNIASSSATISGNGKNIWSAGTSATSITLAANTTAILQYDNVNAIWRQIK